MPVASKFIAKSADAEGVIPMTLLDIVAHSERNIFNVYVRLSCFKNVFNTLDFLFYFQQIQRKAIFFYFTNKLF